MAVHFSEMLISTYNSTHCQNPEQHRHFHSHENLKSDTSNLWFSINIKDQVLHTYKIVDNPPDCYWLNLNADSLPKWRILYTYTGAIGNVNHQTWSAQPLNGRTTVAGQKACILSFFFILENTSITSRNSKLSWTFTCVTWRSWY
jgi:hypothetical protein